MYIPLVVCCAFALIVLDPVLAWPSLKNDGTEIKPDDIENSKTVAEGPTTNDNYTLNQAKHGGRYLHQTTDQKGNKTEKSCKV